MQGHLATSGRIVCDVRNICGCIRLQTRAVSPFTPWDRGFRGQLSPTVGAHADGRLEVNDGASSVRVYFGIAKCTSEEYSVEH